jgi:hypothetical protein
MATPARSRDAGKTKIEVVGLAKLRRDLKAAADRSPEEIAEANKDAAEKVAQVARRKAPRGPHEGGGVVVPIHSATRTYSTARKGVIGIGGSTSPHGVVTEFGGTIPRRGGGAIQRRQVAYARKSHRSFASVGVQSVTNVQAQPYLYPAIAATREEVMDFYVDAIDRVTKRPFPQGIPGAR